MQASSDKYRRSRKTIEVSHFQKRIDKSILKKKKQDIAKFVISKLAFGITLTMFLTSTSSYGQTHSTAGDVIFSKKFTKTLERYDLDFYMPVERWLKLSSVQEDEFLKYDAVLHSPPDVEARIIIKPDSKQMFPNVEIVKMIAHISTNDDDAVVEVTEYPSSRSNEYYGADFVLYADFVPKPSFTTYPRGRLLCMYKEGQALVQYIILYNGALDPYFKMPVRFAELEKEMGN